MKSLKVAEVFVAYFEYIPSHICIHEWLYFCQIAYALNNDKRLIDEDFISNRKKPFCLGLNYKELKRPLKFTKEQRALYKDLVKYDLVKSLLYEMFDTADFIYDEDGILSKYNNQFIPFEEMYTFYLTKFSNDFSDKHWKELIERFEEDERLEAVRKVEDVKK